MQGGERGAWGFTNGVTKEVSPAVNPEAPWVPEKEDLSTSISGAGGPGVREGELSTVKGEGVEEGGCPGEEGGEG